MEECEDCEDEMGGEAAWPFGSRVILGVFCISRFFGFTGLLQGFVWIFSWFCNVLCLFQILL